MVKNKKITPSEQKGENNMNLKIIWLTPYPVSDSLEKKALKLIQIKK